MTWMPLAEQTLDDMETISNNPQTLKVQIEELKVSQRLIFFMLHDIYSLSTIYFKVYSMNTCNVYSTFVLRKNI